MVLGGSVMRRGFLGSFILLAAAGCGTFQEAHRQLIKNGETAYGAVAPLVTLTDIQMCERRVADFKGTFGNTVLELTGPIRPDDRVTCFAYYNNYPPTVPTVYFTAPAKVASGWGGIAPSRDDRLFWCAFQIENGKATIAKSGLGLKGNGLISSEPLNAGIARGACTKNPART